MGCRAILSSLRPRDDQDADKHAKDGVYDMNVWSLLRLFSSLLWQQQGFRRLLFIRSFPFVAVVVVLLPIW
jgi:hypothetical protein